MGSGKGREVFELRGQGWYGGQRTGQRARLCRSPSWIGLEEVEVEDGVRFGSS